MKNTFILGVGAQKSGTSWLYRYLSNSQNVDFGIMKEYHVWDALHIKECQGFLARGSENLRQMMQRNDGTYEDYFCTLIKDQVRITGDITPSYSGLSHDKFKEIRERLELRGFDVKIIFLMRDPFERCWSAVRMDRRKNGAKKKEVEQLRQAYQTPSFIFRTNYKTTIEALEKSFLKNNIYYGIYEEMFDLISIKALSDFCEVPFDPNFATRKFNTSPKTENEVTDEFKQLRLDIIDFYSDVYNFCSERFPQTKDLWRN